MIFLSPLLLGARIWSITRRGRKSHWNSHTLAALQDLIGSVGVYRLAVQDLMVHPVDLAPGGCVLLSQALADGA